MTLQEALTEAARVALAERTKYTVGAWHADEWAVYAGKPPSVFRAKTQGECELFIQSRVNAAVFAWWAENWFKVGELPVTCDALFKALANGEAS